MRCIFENVCVLVSLLTGMNPEECTPRKGQYLHRTVREAGQLFETVVYFMYLS